MFGQHTSSPEASSPARFSGNSPWTSRVLEQRVLHLLARGGRIEIEKHSKRIAGVVCLTREGWRYPGGDLELFRKLRRKKAVSVVVQGGGPPCVSRGAGWSTFARRSTTDERGSRRFCRRDSPQAVAI